MQAATCGVKTAGEITVKARTTSREPNVGIAALRSCKTPYHSMHRTSRRRRSQVATADANKGAHRHITTPDTEMSCPATGMETESELLRSLRVPGTIMTPVAMTKLPNISAQSTAGMSVRTPGGLDFNGVPVRRQG